MAKVFFVGASGVGKSVLAAWAAKEFGWPHLKSPVTPAYAKVGVTHEEAALCPVKMYRAQSQVYGDLWVQLNDKLPENLVTDRSIDLIPYTAQILGDHYKFWDLGWLPDLLKRPDSLTFFVRPHPDVLVKARADDGGRRGSFLADDVVYRIDGAIEFFLVDRGIPYVTIDTPKMKDRCNTVRRCVELLERNV